MVFDALAEERSTAAAGHTSVEPSRPGTSPAGVPAASPGEGHRSPAKPPPDIDRGLRRAIAVVSAAVVVMVAALIGSFVEGGGTPTVAPIAHRSIQAAPPPSAAPVTSTTVPPASSTTTTAVPAVVPAPVPSSSTTSTSTSTPSPQPTAQAGTPVLASLLPSTGTAGQSVVVDGSGFFSPSGHISATVGGRTAPVSCPDQSTCTVTIPPQIGPTATVPVVIVTDGGSSNPLTFTLS